MSRTLDRPVEHHLARLAIADPIAAQQLEIHLTGIPLCGDAHQLARVVDEVIEALALEISFGRKLAAGMGRVLAAGDREDLKSYRRLIRKTVIRGPTLGALFAEYLVPVLVCGDRNLADRFEATTAIMLKKGTYTLKAPLEALCALIDKQDLACAYAFLDLLATTYALDISYNRSVYLTHTLPRAVASFTPSRRLWQLRGLTRAIRENEHLADPFLRGLAAGLHRLPEAGLDAFLDQAIRRYRTHPDSGIRFLALESHLARDVCRNLQVVVPLSSVRADLERYLHARTGLPVAIRPFESLPENRFAQVMAKPLVHGDGGVIYLPEEMAVMEELSGNADLYKLLVRLEAGALEFGTYELDARKARDTVPVAMRPPAVDRGAGDSELERFLGGWRHPDLALDLFTIFEHGRIARKVQTCYPGLFRRLNQALTDSSLLAKTGHRTGGRLWPLYQHLVLGEVLPADAPLAATGRAMVARLKAETVGNTDTAETSARLAMEFYPQLADHAGKNGTQAHQRLSLPMGRRFEPASFAAHRTAYHDLASDIRDQLAARDIRIYRSDIQTLLTLQGGQISAADLHRLIAAPPSSARAVDLSWLNLEALACRYGLEQSMRDTGDPGAHRYREWDWCMGDYIPDHVRVLERQIDASDPAFYRQTLADFNGLVQRIRYAFELLKPEEISILRQWREGDAFDYRALLDYAVDRKAGLIPSDRLFVKRVKQIRDVAALLLVDLSRSTANGVNSTGLRVIDVEKQAIVLLCEALTVVGDRFAIAGFSGTGPLGVDYYRVKDLESPFDEAVKGRISAMAPQRSTRMGAAIRHATALLRCAAARVRLIIVLGDGFPNDLAYKGPYAVEDTRRAVLEARADNIHVKAITVNVIDNDQLDRLYGSHHHTRIGNVRDLPDKLVRVYSSLTRQ